MGYGQKVKKWFFDEDGDEVEEYEDVRLIQNLKQAYLSKQSFLKQVMQSKL